MDIQTLSIISLSVATPIAGVVGFAIQLRQVRKTRLENEKLHLEILALKKNAAVTEQRIVKATTEEVLKVAHGQPMFSRGLESRSSGGGARITSAPRSAKESLKEKLIAVVGLSALVFMAVYLIYDIYRAIIWLGSKF